MKDMCLDTVFQNQILLAQWAFSTTPGSRFKGRTEEEVFLNKIRDQVDIDLSKKEEPLFTHPFLFENGTDNTFLVQTGNSLFESKFAILLKVMEPN